MNQSKFYILAQSTAGSFYNNIYSKDGYDTIEEAKENFNAEREKIISNYSTGGLGASDTKWFIAQLVMAIPLVAPPQYSFQPLTLTDQTKLREKFPFGTWTYNANANEYQRNTQAHESLALKKLQEPGDYKESIWLSPSELYIRTRNMIAAQLWDNEFSNWLETNQTNIEDEIPF